VVETQTSNLKLIPREILFGNPEKTMPRLSPDGKRFTYVAPVNNVLNVWLGESGSNVFKPVTNDTDRGIRAYFWAENGSHLVYQQDVGGNENWRLYGVNLESGETRDLTPFEEVQAQVIQQDKHFPDELLVGLNKENPQLHDVYRLNIVSGELELIAKNPGNFIAWVADAEFQVRAGWANLPDGSSQLMVRENENDEWQVIRSWDSDDALTSSPVSFTLDGKALYLVDSKDANAGRLVKLDLSSGNITEIAADPDYDVGGAMVNPDTYEIEAVAFTRARTEWVALDKKLEADFRFLHSVNAGDFSVISRDRADTTWLVAFTTDNGPVYYYRYVRAERKADFLFVNNAALEEYTLAEMQPVSFEARDGMTVHGYVTFPPNLDKNNLPMVLNVHGGPWARNSWGYNPEAQWFANRGYVCFQVNFRGSTGYGKKFLNAGDREWGAKMHDDLVDAVNWAVAQGYADPERVAIYGGSYGGYAALVGATFTPDLFKCAVDIVGPSNLITLIKSIPPYWATFLSVFHRRVGNPDTEEEFLKSRSPLFKVDNIKIPVLIAQGANDPRVKQAESEQIVEAMRNKNLPYEYMLFPDEGHGFAKPENRFQFYAAAEKFLAKHLGGRSEN
jgi:dipeptidyl aminopeptidase/acylaminoacyl peptidase